MPKHYKHSQKAKGFADLIGIDLLPNQTIVKGYIRQYGKN